MLNRYTFWFKSAIALQLMTGLFHALSFLNTPKGTNEKETQLYDLMTHYKFDLGAGFHPSMNDILNSFSISFSIFLFFSVSLNLFLLKSKLPIKTVKGVILINFIAYSLCFMTMSCLTFLPPIICTGLTAFALLIAYIISSKESSNQ
jgi:hypothetical protein